MQTIVAQERLISSEQCELPEELEHVLRAGADVVDGCIVSRACPSPSYDAVRTDVLDRTGYECFVNHFHFVQADVATGLLQARVFCKEMAQILRLVTPASNVLFILGNNSNEWTVRFHVFRPGERWLSDDLDGYHDEAIMVLDSTELAPVVE